MIWIGTVVLVIAIIVLSLWFMIFKRNQGKEVAVKGLLETLNRVGNDIHREDNSVVIPEVLGVNKERGWSQQERGSFGGDGGDLNRRIKRVIVGKGSGFIAKSVAVGRQRKVGQDRNSRPFTATVDETSEEENDVSFNLKNDSIVTNQNEAHSPLFENK